MAKPSNGLLAKAKAFVRPTRKTWIDALTTGQREEIDKVLNEVRAGGLDLNASELGLLIIETYKVRQSKVTVRKWVSDQLQGVTVGKKA
jgi:hypothetical protein